MVPSSASLGGFRWFSEHLSLFIPPKGTGPNAQAGLGLRVVYDEEAFAIVSAKLHRLRQALGCRRLWESGSFCTPVPDMEMSEPAFLNWLYAEGYCGVLLDLHNLYVTWRNGGISPDAYLAELNLDAIEEIHLAGGDDFGGFYVDSHSGAVPAPVWECAFEYVPRFRRLRALTFEFQETYYERLGPKPIVTELERMHELAAQCGIREVADVG